MFLFFVFFKPDTSIDSNYITIFQQNHAQQGSGLNKCLEKKKKKELQQKTCFWVCSPQIVTSLRTAVCCWSSVPPAAWLGHRAARLVLEAELEPEVQTRLLSPRQGRIPMARRPRCPVSNIWSRTICWGCQSPHTLPPTTPSHSRPPMPWTSLRRAQWEIKLLAGY